MRAPSWGVEQERPSGEALGTRSPGLGRWLWQWVEDHWPADGTFWLLGVDGYFVDVWSAVTEAEVAIVGSAGVLAALGIHRALSFSSADPAG
ncbi:MAG: hypothetical protein AAGD06_32995 [Acidobacteriota bacterium]